MTAYLILMFWIAGAWTEHVIPMPSREACHAVLYDRIKSGVIQDTRVLMSCTTNRDGYK